MSNSDFIWYEWSQCILKCHTPFAYKQNMVLFFLIRLQYWLKWFQSSTPLVYSYFLTTVKLGYNELGYNELGYNEHSVITNKNIYLVGLGHFYVKFSRL